MGTVFLLSIALTQGDPDWHSEAGQEHHAIGFVFLWYFAISIVLVFIAIVCIANGVSSLQYTDCYPWFFTACISAAFGSFNQMLG